MFRVHVSSGSRCQEEDGLVEIFGKSSGPNVSQPRQRSLGGGGLCVTEVSRHTGAYCNNEGLRHPDQSSGVSNLTKPLEPKGGISRLLRGPPTC